jgi:hypothetical protein
MKPIDWTKWSAITQVLGSLAVVVTLIYLTIQTQQNAAAIQASTRHAMIQADVDILMGATAAGVFEVFAMEIPTPTQLRQAEAWLIALVRTREHQWFQYQAGLLDERTFESYVSGLTATLRYPRTRAWWDRFKYDYFDDDFVDAVSEAISSTPVDRSRESPITIAEREWSGD